MNADNVGLNFDDVAAVMRARQAEEEAELGGGYKIKADAAEAPEAEPEQSAEQPKTMMLFKDVVKRCNGKIIDRAEGKEPPCTPTGLSAIDKGIEDLLNAGRLIILAGRPAMGKSILGQQIAENVADGGKTAIFLSLEMQTDDLGMRSISRRLEIPHSRLKKGALTEAEWEKLADLTETAEQSIIYDSDSFDINKLVGKITAADRRIKERKMPPLGIVVVDYLQLINGSGKAANRTLEIGQVTAGLKRLAVNLQVPVLALSQLNRAVDNRNDKRPSLADLRESGSIEQDADAVLFIYRDEYYNPATRDAGIAEVLCGKNRHGNTGTAKLGFAGEYMRFSDIKKAATPAPKKAGKGGFKDEA